MSVKDPESARECIAENRILRKIANQCVEETDGFFVRLPEDDAAFEDSVAGRLPRLGAAGPRRSAPGEAVRLEPNLTPRISRRLTVSPTPPSTASGSAGRAPASAARYGGEVLTYTEAVGMRMRRMAG